MPIVLPRAFLHPTSPSSVHDDTVATRGNTFGSSIPPKKRFDPLACDLSTEAAPVYVETVVDSGERVHLIGDSCLREGIAQAARVRQGHNAIVVGDDRERRDRVLIDVSEWGEKPVAVGKFFRCTADVLAEERAHIAGAPRCVVEHREIGGSVQIDYAEHLRRWSTDRRW